jgi:hypothetical protein
VDSFISLFLRWFVLEELSGSPGSDAANEIRVQLCANLSPLSVGSYLAPGALGVVCSTKLHDATPRRLPLLGLRLPANETCFDQLGGS